MRIRVLVALAVWLAVLSAGGLLFLRALDRDSRPVTPVLGQLPDLRLPALDSPSPWWTSEGTAGHIALINIFASWCVPCLHEHPQMTALREAGFEIHGLLYKDREDQARRWLDRHGNPYRAIGIDADGRAGIELGISGVPETFIIDRQGRIRHHHTGPLLREDLDNTVMPLLHSLLESES